MNRAQLVVVELSIKVKCLAVDQLAADDFVENAQKYLGMSMVPAAVTGVSHHTVESEKQFRVVEVVL